MKKVINGLLRSRFRIATQMYVGIGGAVALTLSASLGAWWSLDRIGDEARDVSEGRVPEMVGSFGIAQQTGILAAAAPRLTTAATDGEFNEVSAEITQATTMFLRQFQTLRVGDAENRRIERIQEFADRLTLNIEEIKRKKAQLLGLEKRVDEFTIEFSQIQDRLDGILIPAIDDQLFFTATGFRQLGESPADPSVHFSEEQLNRYRNVAELESQAHIASQHLANSFTVSDAAFVEPLRERFEAAKGRIERSLSALEGSTLASDTDPLFTHLFDLALRDEGGFDQLARQLELESDQLRLLELNREIAVDLVAEVDGLVSEAEIKTEKASAASEEAILTAQTFLIAISALSVIGAILISWLFVGRMLLRRLQTLSSRMREMADDDFETEVEVSGRDEVAEMGATLEVLRQHALEVQRLNLVEQLANELQAKNQELETVLDELHSAQDQIILKGKLAALGEVTAGVAHEIRNPLNFVHNFSESSEELIEELKETIDRSPDAFTDEQRSLLDEITRDLSDNLERIRSHGGRANRIVNDMLAMGRDAHDIQVTDVNTLLEEYAMLAYHSGRATDPDMQIDMIIETDAELLQIEAIPQDLGRVILNLVTNAWHATEEKRDALAESTMDGSEYMPTLKISTRNRSDGIELRFKDNGTGIPQDVQERIFNPFFTTKSSEKGTGLGLSLSNDIIRGHGGEINVDSELGRYTEFIIQLPLKQPETASAQRRS